MSELTKDIYDRYVQPDDPDISDYTTQITELLTAFTTNIISSNTTSKAIDILEQRKLGMRYIVAYVNSNLPDGCPIVNGNTISSIVDEIATAKLTELYATLESEQESSTE